MTSGEAIRRRREELGLSIAELARRSGLAREYVSKIENGHIGVGAQTAAKLEPMLELEEGELMSSKIEPANFTTLLNRVDGQREVLERVADHLVQVRERLDELLAQAAEHGSDGRARQGDGKARRTGSQRASNN